MAAVQVGGGGAVEINGADLRMLGEEGREIVGLDRVRLDAAVQAAGSSTAVYHIPQGYAVVLQRLESLGIGAGGIEAEQPPHDRPEGIAGMGVVLRRRQRGRARHGAQDQHVRIGPRHIGKAGVGEHVRSVAAMVACDKPRRGHGKHAVTMSRPNSV